MGDRPREVTRPSEMLSACSRPSLGPTRCVLRAVRTRHPLSWREVGSVWRGERPCEGYAYGQEQYAPMRIPHCHSDASTARS